MNYLNLKSLKNKYSKDGFVIVRKLLSKKEVTFFEKKLYSVYGKYLRVVLNSNNIHKVIMKKEKEGSHDILYKCFKKYIKSQPFKEIESKFLKISKKIFKYNYKYLNSGMAIGIKKSKRTAYDWHQEKSYYRYKNTIHFQFPIIVPVKKNNGTMSVLKSSQRLGEIKNLKNIKLSKKSINTFKPVNINKIKKMYKEKFIEMNLGDVCIFHENILHKTNKNSSNKVRFVPIIRLKPF
mgnify:CR=1 FL=1